MSKNNEEPTWPTNPYKGLSFYGPEDYLIFSGREDDIENVSRIIADYSTRICILQGSTGCGKSSFLRAGLIPFLQRKDHGFYFINDASSKNNALFVRSSNDPLAQLAGCLFDFTSKFHVHNETTNLIVDLKTHLNEQFIDKNQFVRHVGYNPEKMLEALRLIGKRVPETLTLIIDQGEEILTINPGSDGDIARQNFFEFMALFNSINIDMKILISLRTEFYGRFIDKIKSQDENLIIRDYLLNELTEIKIEKAILWPTLQEDLDGHGSPRMHYHFFFEENLANKIAQDLREANPSGGILPSMQIVCNNLYQNILSNFNKASEIEREQAEIWKITYKQYDSFGGVEGQIGTYLDNIIENWIKQKHLMHSQVLKEKIILKRVLYSLAKIQIDGTVTTEQKTQDEIFYYWKKFNSKLEFKSTLEYLSHPDHRILIKEERQIFYKVLPCYVLGHDAIGLVLTKWYFSEEGMRFVESRASNIFFITGMTITVLAIFLIFFDNDITIVTANGKHIPLSKGILSIQKIMAYFFLGYGASLIALSRIGLKNWRKRIKSFFHA